LRMPQAFFPLDIVGAGLVPARNQFGILKNE
jgi:hypothetical protein